MKLINLFKLSALCAALASVFACNDAEYSSLENAVYLSEASPMGASNQQIENLTVKGDMVTPIHVRIAKAVDYDIHVNLDYAPEFVQEYNDAHASSYEILPQEYLSFDKTAVIKAGTVSSEDINIDIKSFSTDNGETYCIPIKIVSTDAPFSVSEKSNRLIYLLEAPHMQYVPTFTWRQHPISTNTEWGVTTKAWTIETWVKMSGFAINNSAIISVGIPSTEKGTEIYIRFGDAAIPFNQLQIKTGGSQLETNTLFDPYKWYHLAFTFANDMLTIYVNGEKDADKAIAVEEYVLDKLELCSSGSAYFRNDGSLAQLRMWSRALSQTEIQNAMNRQVPVDSDGLFCYLKLDEGEGMYFNDATGQGHDVECAGENMAPNPPAWSTEKVDFSNPNNE